MIVDENCKQVIKSILDKLSKIDIMIYVLDKHEDLDVKIYNMKGSAIHVGEPIVLSKNKLFDNIEKTIKIKIDVNKLIRSE